MNRIREYRKRKNLTQQALSSISGVPQSTISSVETGVTQAPSLNTILQIATALGVTVDDLLVQEGVKRIDRLSSQP